MARKQPTADLTIEQACDLIGVERTTLWRWAKAGHPVPPRRELPPELRTQGRRHEGYNRAEVERYVAKHGRMTVRVPPRARSRALQGP